MSVMEENLQEHFAAIVAGSDDAIVAKDLDSIVQSWNPAAQRIFGYAADEIVGRSITMLIPQDRQHEEVEFINRLRQGERIEHFKTIRQRKDGELFPVSVSISPIRDRAGQVIGASKIARDITAEQRAAEQQRLLLSEMKHRVGNSFAIASGLLRLSANQCATIDELVDDMSGRFLALSAAHSLAAPASPDDHEPAGEKPLRQLVEVILQPFIGARIPQVDIDDIMVRGAVVTPLALVFYELCTNSVKYGALSQGSGTLSVTSERTDGRLVIRWDESFVSGASQVEVSGTGFGTSMCEAALEDQLDGSFTREFHPDGMRVRLDVGLDRLCPDPAEC